YGSVHLIRACLRTRHKGRMMSTASEPTRAHPSSNKLQHLVATEPHGGYGVSNLATPNGIYYVNLLVKSSIL
ncbi:MAG: hypothetical protein VX541_00590, partial [Candidatus Poribacteria bacterium]|nr:hypothetical protein [Candidatus Poribacteria bacterium]